MKMLITSGGTSVDLDEVRRIQNMSSGRFGAKIATAALQAGNGVFFLHAHNSVTPFTFNCDVTEVPFHEEVRMISRFIGMMNFRRAHEARYRPQQYRTFHEYHAHLKAQVVSGNFDVVVLAAAVSDYGPPGDTTEKKQGKISSDREELMFRLEPLPKLIAQVKQWNSDLYLVGFKLLVDATFQELAEAAMKQIDRCGSDLVVSNDLHDIKKGNHKLHLFDKKGYVKTLQESQTNLAEALVEEISLRAVATIKSPWNREQPNA